MGHAGHVERHSAQEAVSTRVVLPLAVIATNNVSRMVELWTQFRCVAKPFILNIVICLHFWNQPTPLPHSQLPLPLTMVPRISIFDL